MRALILSSDRLRTSRPFLPVIIAIAIIAVACAAAAAVLLAHAYIDDPQTYPLFSATATVMAIAVAAVGWGVAGWVSHRNGRVQHTINLLSTRFSQATFVQNAANFVDHFGPGGAPLVTRSDIDALTVSKTEAERNAARAVRYLLNYFEFIAVGVRRGDIDLGIVRENWRGVIRFYVDRCRPYIDALRDDDPRTFEHLVRLRSHFED